MYRLTRFATIDLQKYNQVDTIGTGSTPTAYQVLPEGGALDLFSDQQKHPGTVERSKSMRLTASTEAAVEALYFQLIALRGRRERLYRQTASGDIHWQYARLVEVTAERSYEQTKYKRIQDISLRFITQEAFWRGDFGGVWTLDAGEYLDAGLAYDSGETYPLTTSPTTFTVSIGTDAGRAPIRAVRMSIKAGASSMSAVTIARAGGESITFSGTILANKTLVIDTGTMQVLNDGVDAYNNLTLLPTADLASWFVFVSGNNNITVTFTGGGTGKEISFSYYEVWY
jgi:hypothetical protein